MENKEQYEEVIDSFHQMWDGFPGIARLIDKNHCIIASNDLAIEKGFEIGNICAKVGLPETHKGCKMVKMFKTGQAQTDRVLNDRIRGWMTVAGYPELMVHFTMMIPENEEEKRLEE